MGEVSPSAADNSQRKWVYRRDDDLCGYTGRYPGALEEEDVYQSLPDHRRQRMDFVFPVYVLFGLGNFFCHHFFPFVEKKVSGKCKNLVKGYKEAMKLLLADIR